MKSELEQIIAAAVQSIYDLDTPIVLSRPEEQYGDYATNVALQLAGQVSDNPRSIAEKLVTELNAQQLDDIASISIAGPGFINITMSDSALHRALSVEPRKSLAGQVIVTEYSDPNPFKVLHAGHLYTSVIGDAIANTLEQAGASVHRVNFGGDVGMHVAKTMWAMIRELGGENPEKLQDIPADQRAEWMAKTYVQGSQAYDDDEAAKAEMVVLNKRIYALHNDNDHDSPFAQMYWTCREWSYDYFNAFYARIGSSFERYYPESQTAPVGLETVRAHIEDGVYTESDGAIVFDGDAHGLHTRVFINSEGLPTYEAKDVGLIMLKKQDYNFDKSVIITANEIEQYMQVVLKSIEQFAPDLVRATTHLTHGMVKLKGGVKMSSRKGNFLRAVDVLDSAATAAQQISGKAEDSTVLGAVKYAFLKNRMGGDVIYDPEESVSIEGNSGPYLQYAHARARSILSKSQVQSKEVITAFDQAERSFVRKLTEYPEVVDRSVQELMPHHIATYLYELAQTFNRFYEHNRVIGDAREAIRIQLIEQYCQTLKAGLGLLGIEAPERM